MDIGASDFVTNIAAVAVVVVCYSIDALLLFFIHSLILVLYTEKIPLF